MQILQSIQNRIYEVRGQRGMLDFDLAILYETETKSLKRSVKRNIARFPVDFMFELTPEEWESLRYQIGTLNNQHPLQGQKLQGGLTLISAGGGRGQHLKYMPYAFTEQGVAMLAGILNSDKAIAMNIAIMRAFVELRRVLMMKSDITEQLRLLQSRIGEHDTQLSGIYDAIENLLDDKAAQRKWDDRERIGFKK